MRKFLFLSSFWLKIIALFTMTVDHIGYVLQAVYFDNYDILALANVFRVIGRFALPLFIFMIVEGVIHTKSISKYFLRLGVMAALISITLAILQYVPLGYDTSMIKGAGNIFLDLLLTAVAIYALNHKNNWMKLLILLPIIISVSSFIAKGYEFANAVDVLWYPEFLYLQYDWFSILLGVAFYYAGKLGKAYISMYAKKINVDQIVFDENGYTQLAKNILYVVALALASFIFYLPHYFWIEGVYWDAMTQLSAIFAGAFILFYNGKRGYNAKWFQYGSYIYYPLSMLVMLVLYIILT